MNAKMKMLGRKLFLQMVAVVLMLAVNPIRVSAEEQVEPVQLIEEPLVGNLNLYATEGAENYFDKGITGYNRCMPSVGDVKTLVFAVEFADKPFEEEDIKATLEKSFFSEENPEDKWYPNESLRAFYQRSSFGKLNITGEVYTFTSEHNRSYYDGNIALLAEDILKEFEADKLAEFNGDEDALNEYLKQFDINEDNIFDGIYIYYAGGSDSWGTEWWSYVTIYDSLNLGDYSLGNTCIFGTYHPLTIIHETGHMLGLVDYYDYEASEEGDWQEGMYGIAGIDMMQGNAGDHNVFSKMLLGWIEPENITVITEGVQEVELKECREAGDCVIIVPDYDENVGLYTEFFLVDFREYQGYNTDLFFDDYNKDIEGGICIYYVNATLTEDKKSFLYDSGYAGKYGEIPLIRQIHADGEKMHSSNEIVDFGILFTWPWERAGHEDTCFYHAGDEFTPYSLPSSAVYGERSLNEKRSYSGVVVKDIIIGEDTAKVTLGIEEENTPETITYEVDSASGTYSAIDSFKAELYFSTDITLEDGVNEGKNFIKAKGAKLLNAEGTEIGDFTVYLSKRQNGYVYLGISDALRAALEEDKIYSIVIPAGTFYDSTGNAVPEINIEYSTCATYEIHNIWEGNDEMPGEACLDMDGNGLYIEKKGWWQKGDKLNLQLISDYTLQETIPSDNVVAAMGELCGNGYFAGWNVYKVSDEQWGLIGTSDNKIYLVVFDNTGSVIKKESIAASKNVDMINCLDELHVAAAADSEVYFFEGDGFKKFSFEAEQEAEWKIGTAWGTYAAGNEHYLLAYSQNNSQGKSEYAQLIFDKNGQIKAYLQEEHIHDFEYKDGKYYLSNYYFELDQCYSFISVYDETFEKIEEYYYAGSVYFIDQMNDGFVIRDDNGFYIVDEHFNIVEELEDFPAYYVYGMNDNIILGTSSEGGVYIDVTGINMDVEDENAIDFRLENVEDISIDGHTITMEAMSKAEFEALLEEYNYELEGDGQALTNDSVLKIISENEKCAYYYYFNIEKKLQGISLTKTELSLAVGASESLQVKYNPTDTTDDKTIEWISSDKAIATVSSTGKVTGVKSGTATITAKVGGKTATCLVTVKREGEYIGNVNSELLKFKYDEETNYISGEIVVVEWVDGKSTVPTVKPVMTFDAVDGSESIDVFVTATGTNTYYFDRRLSEGLTPGKEYVFNVTSGNELNVGDYTTVPIYTGTSAIGANGELGTVKSQKICYKTDASTGYLLVYGQPDTYVGNVNSVLSGVQCVTADNGNNFVSGNIVIVEWIDGKSTVPTKTPKMTFEAYDGTESMDVFMVSLDGTNTYYFDRNLTEDMDVTKDYIFRISLTDERNVSEYKSMIATTNYMDEKEGLLWETATQKVMYKTVPADGDNQLRIYAVNK